MLYLTKKRERNAEAPSPRIALGYYARIVAMPAMLRCARPGRVRTVQFSNSAVAITTVTLLVELTLLKY